MHRTRIVCLAIFLAIPGLAQKAPSRPASVPAPSATAAVAPDAEALDRTRHQLMESLRLSPRLTEVLSRDPSLLGDANYVQQKNPDLARFLEAHPEVVRNPEFYLFGPGERLQDIRWNTESERERVVNRILSDAGPVVGLTVFFICGVWLLRLVMDNLRWRRVVHLQTDVHNKLLDKFGNSQELLAYMQTDAGKRFLEGAPISVALGSEEPSWGSPIVRIMRPLQIGIVVGAAGIGFLGTGYEGMQIVGKIMLMVGLGFIISAAASWLIARQAGILGAGQANDAANRAL